MALVFGFGLGSLANPSSCRSLLVSAQHLTSEKANTPQHRHNIAYNVNVAGKIKEEHANRVKHFKFTMVAIKIEAGSNNVRVRAKVDMEILEMNPTVMDDTINEFSDEDDGNEPSIVSVGELLGKDSLATILVTHPLLADWLVVRTAALQFWQLI